MVWWRMGMVWQWPVLLWLLVLLPLCAVAYGWVLRRRRKYAARFSSLALVRAARPPRWGGRRHVPFAFMLLALGSLVGALGRPMAAVPVTGARATVLLVIDISLSMCATDIEPSRLEAAQAAALAFIAEQPSTTQIGVVAFGSFAELVQAPTTDQRLLQAAVRRLDTGLGTAIGSGLETALRAIDELQPSGAPPPDRPEGQYAPEVIVLLTDGVATVGAPPLEAAAKAAERGVRIFPIGFGTSRGTFAPCSSHGDVGSAPGGAASAGWAPRLSTGFHEGIDEVTLQEIANLTGGRYHAATSAGELNAVLAGLPAVFTSQTEWMEVSVGFAGLGALLALAAFLLSMRWNGVA